MSGLKAVTILVAALGCLLGKASAYPNGAPTSQCASLLPGHGHLGTGTPYTIELDSDVTSYSEGTAVTVTITGAQYQGFILQARAGLSETPLGTFSAPPNNTKLIHCSAADDTVTHSSATEKDDLAYTWNPPSGDSGYIYFIATVAESQNTWWVNALSNTLYYSNTGVNSGSTWILLVPVYIALTYWML